MSMTTEAAPAAAIVTERPRDLPNASADRQALGLVRPYLGMVAWPTVFLAIGIVASFILVSTLATMRIIPLWLGLILNSFILYLDQTPLHKAFRYMHLAHHRDTNNPDLDPDNWVAVHGPFKVLWRCLTIVYWYHQYFWKHIAFHAHIPGMRPLTIQIASMYT